MMFGSTKAPAPVEIDPDLRLAPRPRLGARLLDNTGTWVLLLDVALIAVFTVLSPNGVFWSLTNFQSLALQGTQLVLISVGIALFMSAGFIDISVGANLVLSSVIGARVMLTVAGDRDPATGEYAHTGQAIVVSALVCLLCGLLFGIINGFFIAVVGVNSLIVTLGTTGIATGAALLLTSGTDIGNLPEQVQTGFGISTLGPIPVPTLIALAVAALVWAYFRFSRYGTYTLAIGSSRPAAERAGIRVKPQIVALAATSGALAGLAGFMSLAQYGATTISGHVNDPLAAITAVVIGGTMLEGGRVSIPGTIYGVALALILQAGLVIIGIQAFWQLAAIGIVLLLAVSIDQVRNRRRQR